MPIRVKTSAPTINGTGNNFITRVYVEEIRRFIEKPYNADALERLAHATTDKGYSPASPLVRRANAQHVVRRRHEQLM